MKGSRQAGRRSPSPAVLKFGFMQGQAPRSFATHANRPAGDCDIGYRYRIDIVKIFLGEFGK